MADAETTPGLRPNLVSRHEPAHIGTYALPGLRGRAAVWLVMGGLGRPRAAYPSVGPWLEVGADLLCHALHEFPLSGMLQGVEVGASYELNGNPGLVA